MEKSASRSKSARKTTDSLFVLTIREELVKKRIKKVLDSFGTFYQMVVPTRFSCSGMPDFICWHPVEGRDFSVPFAIEAKGKQTSGKQGKLRASQEKWIDNGEKHKLPCFVIDNSNVMLLPLIIQSRGIPFHAAYKPKQPRINRKSKSNRG